MTKFALSEALDSDGRPFMWAIISVPDDLESRRDLPALKSTAWLFPNRSEAYEMFDRLARSGAAKAKADVTAVRGARRC